MAAEARHSPERAGGSPAAPLPEGYLGRAVYFGVEFFQVSDGLPDGDARDEVPPERGHLPPAPLGGEFVALDAESGGEDAVGGDGGAPALDVAEAGDAGLEPGARLDLVGKEL